MNTEKRLNEAYRKAKCIPIDQKTKMVFFSDHHRGDDSISDEFARNQALMLSALQYYYSKGFTYVEVGDGDELWQHRSFKHIRTAHTDIFTVMKALYQENRLIILYGNHNIYMKQPYYVKKNYYYYYDEYYEREEELFVGLRPLEAIRLQEKQSGNEILVLHGHQGDFLNDQFWIPSMLALRYFWKFMYLIGFRNPASPAKNQSKRHKIEKNYSKWIVKHKVAMICGHTHRLKFPKSVQVPYFNCGCCIHTKGITGIEIENGKIMLVQWRIQADQEGIMRVKRILVRDGMPIANFFKKD
ncbi:metallophosphoesterase [Anaerosporobacter faecicola]|uniref:metallophosphoesterase n=1 Tax=Anaerosporobacter faecicola TaxID=2718714 RepID=UPI00143B0FFB|nr:metallophosphoesterase [Anaerosporobacter faecicola]